MDRSPVIAKILIANRGEIACRIIRTCRAMGIASVAVFSDADAAARHVHEADEAVRIGPGPAAESYLNSSALIAAALRARADAVHPGYGFLAESAPFAMACRQAGLTFIGPEPDVIALMGSKREAKRLATSAGVPVVPGYEGDDQSDERFLEAARALGYPVMVKASAGGGGKGMRSVARPADLRAALAAARREALAAFGDASLLLEKVIAEPRHVEFQIFGDTHGNVIHLGERECSIQRRHQKVIEETPSPALTPDLRARMGAAAVLVGRQLSYTNAGTVEFLLDEEGHFYFLEVNTRLQVEHPITELVTGLDLVRWQILVAQGHPLPLPQEDVPARGHAIEARVYAEDPATGFLPMSGPVALWREPAGPGIRVDSGTRTGDTVSTFYDPLLAKISAHGADRAEALRRLGYALGQTTLLGVRGNLAFLRRIVLDPAHVAGELSTAFIPRHAADLLAPPLAPRGEQPAARVRTAALVAALQRALTTADPRGWRNNPGRPAAERFAPLEPLEGGGYAPRAAPVEVRLGLVAGRVYEAAITDADGALTVSVRVHEHSGPDLRLELDGHLTHAVALELGGHEWWVQMGGETYVLAWRSPLPEPEERGQSTGTLFAPMPGQVVTVLVEPGQIVRAGDPVLILHAMKMEHTIVAPVGGHVTAVHFRAGDSVPAAAILLDIGADPAD